jgi:EAL domain-containing protein (putative c-di-GMP-specific phosphodiesterase class I)
LAVNLSARSLEGFDIVDTVTELTAIWAVPPYWLTLEITEGALINASAATVLDRLNQIGERLSIDDYGSGYSALSYLRRLPVHEVKIDKSFVMDLASSAGNATIVRSTVELGHDLGLKVCAEGVEDAAAQQMLAEYGCDLAQGFFISHPLPATDLQAWLPVEEA